MIDATPLLRVFASRRMQQLARTDVETAQRQQLGRLVHRARDTRFGRDHGFDRIRSVEDYQGRVPVRTYEDFWEGYWKESFPIIENATWPGRVSAFAATSGTTAGRTKFIPLTGDMMRSNRRATRDLLAFHVTRRPRSRILGGKSFFLGGSTEVAERAPGVEVGDLSGIAMRHAPAWTRPFTFPPSELLRIADWERKVDVLGRLSLKEDIRLLGGTTSWLMLFIEHLRKLKPGGSGRLVDFYPNLELLVHGGVAATLYQARLEALLEGSHAELREVYPASEGFIGLADRGPGEGLRMTIDNGIFYEFVPADELGRTGPRFWIGNVETGVNYAILLSTCAGMWSYVLGDTVRFLERDPPRFLVTGRTSYSLSAFGEHLIGEEIERAVSRSAAAICRSVVDFAVGPVFETDGRGGHLFVVEFAEGVPDRADVTAFARRVDRELSEANEDYEAHRVSSFGMNAPKVAVVPPGALAGWMKARGKLGGQNKVPRVVTDPAMLASLEALSRQGPISAEAEGNGS